MAVADTFIRLFVVGKYVVIYGWPFILLVWLYIVKKIWEKWPLDAVVIEKRGNNLIETTDWMGKFKDPYTKLTGYRLRKAKDTIPVVNFEWMLHSNTQHITFLHRIINILRGKKGTIFMFRYGTKQYKPIKISTKKGAKIKYKEIKDKDGKPIILTIYEQFDPRKHLGALDFNVIDWDNMNFMIQEMTATEQRRRKKSEFWKQLIVPLGMMAMAALVVIVMIKFGYDYAIDMANRNTPNVKEPAGQPDIPVIGDMIPAG